jgi:Family of unknown function (DUF6496)
MGSPTRSRRTVVFAGNQARPKPETSPGDQEGGTMAKYGKSASKSVKSTMHRRKKGTLESGSGRKVKSRKQAIAIGLNEARKKGAKVPRRSSATRKRAGKKR